MSNSAAKFPTGSIIVREKLSASPLQMGNGPSSPLILQPKRIEDLGVPLILVVMLKRESGFNPKANDWEFLTVSGDGSRIEKREKNGACLNCHKAESKRDFVFRDNLP